MIRALSIVGPAALGLMLMGGARLEAQGAGEPDPCEGAKAASDLRACWVRETEQAERSLDRVYDTLLARLPHEKRERLKKAQQLWVDFRDAHVNSIYVNRGRTRDPYLWTCVLIARHQLTVARTRQLELLLQSPGDEACPL